MNDKKIEELLRKAPAPRVPEGLLERLEEDIELPGQPSHQSCNTGGALLRHWIPVVSTLAATVAVLAGVAAMYFWQSPVAYSFEKTIEALSNVDGMRLISRSRSGPGQPIPGSDGAVFTSYHPANPMVERQIYYQNVWGREMSRIESPERLSLRNGPLALSIDLQRGERNFTLVDRPPLPDLYVDPVPLFVDLAAAAEAGDLEYDVSRSKDYPGTLELDFSRNFDVRVHRLWIDAETFLPIRLQIYSTRFPEYGSEVLMTEIEYHDLGTWFDLNLFEIDPTDSELDALGLTREDLDLLPGDVLSIQIDGTEGVAVVVDVYDDNGHRVVRGALPLTFLANPAGDLVFNVKSEDGQVHRFTVRFGGNTFYGSDASLLGFSRRDGATGIVTGPIEAESLEDFRRFYPGAFSDSIRD